MTKKRRRKPRRKRRRRKKKKERKTRREGLKLPKRHSKIGAADQLIHVGFV